MKNLFKKATAFLLCFSIFIHALSFISPTKIQATDTEYSQSADVSSCRKIYISEDDKGYSSTENTELSFWNPITKISVTSDNLSVSSASGRGMPIICISDADNFAIDISFADKKDGSTLYENTSEDKEENTITTEKYTISHDSWGATQKGKKEQTVTVNGLQIATGEIASGALIIQTSFDGISWEQIDYGKYTNGLYTTDVLDY